MDDDLYDEDVDELQIDQKGWRKINDARLKDGFREGISSGQDSTLQSGFNDGFTKSLPDFVIIGELRGMLCGILGHQQTTQTVSLSTEHKDKIELLVQKISETEQEWMQNDLPPLKSDITKHVQEERKDDKAQFMEELFGGSDAQGADSQDCDKDSCCKSSTDTKNTHNAIPNASNPGSCSKTDERMKRMNELETLKQDVHSLIKTSGFGHVLD